MSLIIGQIKKEIQGNQAILYSIIKDNNEDKKLTYTIDKKFEKYLTDERADAFVVSLLYYALIKGLDIQWETPCDAKLIYQLNTYFIPVYVSEFSFMKAIKLSGPVTNIRLHSEGFAATGLSNGVDTCYSIHKYISSEYDFTKLKYLIFTDWFITDYSEEAKKDFLENNLKLLPVLEDEVNIETIYVDFNIGDVARVSLADQRSKCQ